MSNGRENSAFKTQPASFAIFSEQNTYCWNNTQKQNKRWFERSFVLFNPKGKLLIGKKKKSHLLSQVSIHLKKRIAPDPSYFSPRTQKCCWLNQICFTGRMSLTRFSLSSSLQYSQAGAMMGTMGENSWIKHTKLYGSF